MSDIIIVNDEASLQKLIDSGKTFILAIGAPWCVDCRRAQPFYLQFAKTYSDTLLFASANCDEFKGIRERYDVKHIPTMIIFKDGKPLPGRLVEVQTPGQLKDFIEEGLAA
ncbi:co-chaperone YbbN [Sutterella sp.]|uniref:thioredoxin family protein n=1 Tax=Sutterella sp. TaxID=1981025 RepID=UPI0026E06642|nr:thioredoxin family protein [Sutterella sp.]MDO5532779.1 thioredoxin family protein [Sutterella sp.]